MGTSYQKTTNCTLIRDHPHAYGDKKSKCLTRGSAKGSSPRVWGQAVANILHPKEVGIIPTRMGTRCRRRRIFYVGEDHPHAYGDKCLAYYLVPCQGGSSPRVWGQALRFALNFADTRIIPTRMGTRRQSTR